MARYTGPTARRWRRIGQIPPDGSGTAVTRRNFPPGQHGLRRGAKLSEFGQQLQEKQKAKYTYGLLERQFANYYRKADRQYGITGENLMRMLECRLDNVVFRLGLATTRAQARQLVNHGHVFVSGRKIDIPSYQVSEQEQISFAGGYRKQFEQDLVNKNIELDTIDQSVPDWLSLNKSTLTGNVVAMPSRLDIDASINEQLIVEYYSR